MSKWIVIPAAIAVVCLFLYVAGTSILQGLQMM